MSCLLEDRFAFQVLRHLSVLTSSESPVTKMTANAFFENALPYSKLVVAVRIFTASH
jgi:hypothetical protein